MHNELSFILVLENLVLWARILYFGTKALVPYTTETIGPACNECHEGARAMECCILSPSLGTCMHTPKLNKKAHYEAIRQSLLRFVFFGYCLLLWLS